MLSKWIGASSSYPNIVFCEISLTPSLGTVRPSIWHMWHTCDHRQGEAPHTHLVSPGWPIFSRWLAVHPLTSPTWPKCCSPVSWLRFVVMHCNTIKMKIYEISTFTFDPFRPNQLEKLEAAKVSDLLLPLVTFSYLCLPLVTFGDL